MEYAIQIGLFRGNHEEKLVKALERFGFRVHYFKHIPFTRKLKWVKKDPSDDFALLPSRKPKSKNIMAFGSVAFSHFASEYDWYPGSFYNENHDYVVYSKIWKDHLLNWDSKIQRMIDPVEEEFFFARPTGDNKAFKGELYGKAMWDWAVSNGIMNGADPNTMVQISSPKEIMQEVRCFVVMGKVITASFYKIGDSVVYRECNDEDILDYAQARVDEFQLADAFVIDICRTDKGLKIVECNCINASGFYDIDEQKFILALEENFSK